MLRNITLSAEATEIQSARKKAVREQTTLNNLFRIWLYEYTHAAVKKNEFANLMKNLGYARAGRRFTRDDMNER